jgi:two-component system OmpR family sensor kinase
MRVPLNAADLAVMSNPGEPFTTDVVGVDGRARAIAIQLDSETWILGAISTEAVEDAQRQLFVTGAGAVAILAAGLAVIIWWVDRLGIRPIIEVTRAAEDGAAGRTDRRVEHPAQTTEAGRLGAAFNTMLDERQASEDRQRRFVADASHELRTPLTTLRGYAALYESGGLIEPEQVDHAMQRIKGEAARMEALVDDLLTLAGLDDHQPLQIESIDLSRLLADIAADAGAVQPGRLVVSDGVQSDLSVKADIHQLTKALTTIVSNVLRHTPTNTDLILRAVSQGDHVSIEISDTGPGIEAEHVDRLFDRFYRVEAGRSRAKGGSGLGLSIAKAIIEAHQGTIKIVSSTGSSEMGAPISPTGTTISITLPTN